MTDWKEGWTSGGVDAPGILCLYCGHRIISFALDEEAMREHRQTCTEDAEENSPRQKA